LKFRLKCDDALFPSINIYLTVDMGEKNESKRHEFLIHAFLLAKIQQMYMKRPFE